MISDFAEKLYNSAMKSDLFSNFKLVKAYDFEKLKFPVRNTVVSFDSEKNDRMNFLLGYDIFESGEEKVVVTVLTDEKQSGGYCEQCAKEVCMKILKLDINKMIISVAVERCMYDTNAFAYKIKMTFGLRESAINIGEE